MSTDPKSVDMEENNPEMSEERLLEHLKFFGEIYQNALTNLAK